VGAAVCWGCWQGCWALCLHTCECVATSSSVLHHGNHSCHNSQHLPACPPPHQTRPCRSVLLLEDKTPVGRVEEVFGPLTLPLYALRYGGPSPAPPGLTTNAKVFFTGGNRLVVGFGRAVTLWGVG
jgi:hypothetical protein